MVVGWAVDMQSQAQSESIHGIVLNGVTHDPIPRALVYSPDNRFATLTSSEGRFEFNLTKPAVPETGSSSNLAVQLDPNETSRPYSLAARKPGFMPDPNPNGQNLRGDVSKDLVLTLIPESLIAGSVTLPTSEAQDGVTLQIFRRQIQDGHAQWVPAGGTQSASDGQFRFADLAAGSYKLLTREQIDRDPVSNDPVTLDQQGYSLHGPLFGYPPVYYQNASDFESAALIQLAPGQTQTVNLTLSKQRYYRVRIPVISAANDGTLGPINAMHVSVYAHGHKGPGFSLGYNNEEHAIEGMLPNGTYNVEASSFGSNGFSGMQSIAIRGAPLESSAMTLAANASIRVIVREEFTRNDGNPTATWNINGRNVVLKGPRRYLNVTLEPADDIGLLGGAMLRDPSRSGDDPLVIDGVAAGRYWVRIRSPLYYAASVRSGNLDLLHQPLAVGIGGTPSPIEITMRDDTAEISGTVEGVGPVSSTQTEGSGNGSYAGSGVHIYCVPTSDSSGEFLQATLNSDGSFSFSKVVPGAYRLLAFDHAIPDFEYRNPEAMQVYDSKGLQVRLTGGQKEHVQLPLIVAGAAQP